MLKIINSLVSKRYVYSGTEHSVKFLLIVARSKVSAVAGGPTRWSASSYIHNPGRAPLRYRTAGEELRAAAERYPARLALRSDHEDISLTYEQLITQAEALGCGVRKRGLERGDRVAVWAHNCAAWVTALVATLRVGLIPVAINPVYEKPELSFCLKKTGCKALLIGEAIPSRNYYNMVSELVPELRDSRPGELHSEEFPDLKCVITAGQEALPGTITSDSLIRGYEQSAKSEASKFSDEVSPDDGCIIHFTSGTTGEPKAALDSHFGVVNNTHYIAERNTLIDQHHNICVQVPIFHALGSLITVLSALHHGASLVLAAPVYNVQRNLQALIKHKCSLIIGTPTMFVDLVSAVRASPAHPAPACRVALTAGAPCTPQLFRDIQNYLNVDSVKSLYGMTETTASVFMSLPGESMELVTDTVGYIQDHVEVKVVDENDRAVPWGAPGELLVRGYSTMMCYWDEPEKTRQALGEDGWLRTGDIFKLSRDGYARIVGRQKDIIVRGGENIAPKEIEDMLDTHPDVIESQVVGVHDARLGEEVCAVVRARSSSLTLQQLVTHCDGHLARYKQPRLLRLVHQFPKTTSGKIQKYKLKEMIQQGKL